MKGKDNYLSKKFSIRLTRRVSPPYLFQVDSASEALECVTNTFTKLVGKLNLSKDAAVYPPFFEYFWFTTVFGNPFPPGAMCYNLITWKKAYLQCSLPPSDSLAISPLPWVKQCLDY